MFSIRVFQGLLLGAVCLTVPYSLVAQSSGAAKLTTGKQIWDGGCSGCHGPDGKGVDDAIVGFQKPDSYPDFSRCDQTTAEDNLTWNGIIHDGGTRRGYSTVMPSFRGALTDEQIDKVVQYMRGFCKTKGWPRGEFNLPRALVVEKAFPEDETIVTTTLNARGAPAVGNEIVHEQRFGTKNQIEVSVPVDFQRAAPGQWYGGFGDVVLGMKRVIYSSLHTGNMLSLQGEAIFPTGSLSHGLGSGVMTFENFAAFSQLLPGDSFLQLQGGADLPVDTSKAPQSLFFRGALGKSFSENDGYGRTWSPMVEALGSRDLMTGAQNGWDILPEMQVTLSRRLHVRFDVGYRMPVINRAKRENQVIFYFLWDWQDGKLTEGW